MSTTHVASAYIGLLISQEDVPKDFFSDDTENVFRGYRAIRCDTRVLVIYQTVSISDDGFFGQKAITFRDVMQDAYFAKTMAELYHPDNVVLVAGYHNY